MGEGVASAAGPRDHRLHCAGDPAETMGCLPDEPELSGSLEPI